MTVETELKFMALDEPEIFQHGEIPIEYPGTWYRVAAGVPKCSKRLQHVRLRVEPATGISHSGIENSRLTCGGGTIGKVSRIRLIGAHARLDRVSSLDRHNRADLPAADKPIGPHERQFV